MTKSVGTMHLIEPDWPAPESVRAFTTTRHSGAEPEVMQRLPGHSHCRRLQQVHGARVVDAVASADDTKADGCFSRSPLYACRVLTADCLPLLICNRRGTEIAAVHAGWRGLAAGVIENCIEQLHTSPEDLLVWLGPAISQAAFEVGEEVQAQLLATAPAQSRDSTRACFRPGAPGKYYADLYALARLRLENLGITYVYGGEYCTFSQADLFHSYRRDGTIGRMISAIVFK